MRDRSGLRGQILSRSSVYQSRSHLFLPRVIRGTITIGRKLSQHNITASAGIYQPGVAVRGKSHAEALALLRSVSGSEMDPLSGRVQRAVPRQRWLIRQCHQFRLAVARAPCQISRAVPKPLAESPMENVVNTAGKGGDETMPQPEQLGTRLQPRLTTDNEY